MGCDVVGLSRLEEVEHENSMAQLEKDPSEEEITETYTEEIMYFNPRKAGHYTAKEVGMIGRDAELIKRDVR